MLRREVCNSSYAELDSDVCGMCLVEVLGNGNAFLPEEYLIKFPGAYSMSGMFLVLFRVRWRAVANEL